MSTIIQSRTSIKHKQNVKEIFPSNELSVPQLFSRQYPLEQGLPTTGPRGLFLGRQDFFKMLLKNKGPARVFLPQK
jgi:hypothetical protein